jgi:hypothetical protein
MKPTEFLNEVIEIAESFGANQFTFLSCHLELPLTRFRDSRMSCVSRKRRHIHKTAPTRPGWPQASLIRQKHCAMGLTNYGADHAICNFNEVQANPVTIISLGSRPKLAIGPDQLHIPVCRRSSCEGGCRPVLATPNDSLTTTDFRRVSYG